MSAVFTFQLSVRRWGWWGRSSHPPSVRRLPVSAGCEEVGVAAWTEAVIAASSFSRLHLLLAILDSSVKWDKSAEAAVSGRIIVITRHLAEETVVSALNSGASMALMWFARPQLQPRQTLFIRVVRIVAVTRSPRYLQNSVFKISFCSTVARIRPFHVNNKPVGCT